MDFVRRTGRTTEGGRRRDTADEDLVSGEAAVVEPGEEDSEGVGEIPEENGPEPLNGG